MLLNLKENEKIVRGNIQLTKEEKQKELLEPTTMLYGELAEKNGYVNMLFTLKQEVPVHKGPGLAILTFSCQSTIRA